MFTGGTISMSEDPATGALRPIDFNRLQEYMPELKRTGIRIKSVPFLPLLDSSDVYPPVWERIALLIQENYEEYDGFVVLHGTDTMAYTASALSFMLENLSKPVIFTGAQLPIGMTRSDAKENLITAIEIATANENGQPIVPEVCIFFEDNLFRANRTTKKNAEHFSAFNSYNYPPLAKAGVHIKFFRSYIHYPSPGTALCVRTKIDQNVAILKLFPGITEHTVNAILNIPGLKAVVLESFGAGNAPRQTWFFNSLKNATERGILIANKTQCSTGSVEMGRYETSLNLMSAGVISAYDSTTEAIVTKLMYLLGQYENIDDIKHRLSISMCGEMTVI
ncbi:MAG: asparaginase [Paludibacter sp.]|nr:asparaginase [Paludibacter sp.]